MLGDTYEVNTIGNMLCAMRYHSRTVLCLATRNPRVPLVSLARDAEFPKVPVRASFTSD